MHIEGDRFTLDLSPLAREVVVSALWQNEGPWDPSDGLARVLGFADAAHLCSATPGLRSAIERDEPLNFDDWWRAFRIAETVALTYSLGIRSEWQTATGIDEVDALAALTTVEAALYGAVNDGAVATTD